MILEANSSNPKKDVSNVRLVTSYLPPQDMPK